MQRRESLTIGVAAALLAGSASTSYGVNVWLSFESDPAAGPATDKLNADGAVSAHQNHY